MNKQFLAAVQSIEETFPELADRVIGGAYPVPPIVRSLYYLMILLQIVGMAWMVMGGDKLFRFLGYKHTLPSIYYTVQNNPIPIAIFIYLLAPHIVSKLGSTNGAFEVYLDDRKIFSRFSTGRFPTIEDIAAKLISAGFKRKV